MPGIRMSLIMASGDSCARRCNKSSPFSKLTVFMPVLPRDFSSTQRIDRSSSTIQTELCVTIVKHQYLSCVFIKAANSLISKSAVPL